MAAPIDVLELYNDNLARSECYALWGTFLSFLSAALANETAKIARQQ